MRIVRCYAESGANVIKGGAPRRAAERLRLGSPGHARVSKETNLRLPLGDTPGATRHTGPEASKTGAARPTVRPSLCQRQWAFGYTPFAPMARERPCFRTVSQPQKVAASAIPPCVSTITGGPRFQLCRAFRKAVRSTEQALTASAGAVRRATWPRAIQIRRRLRSP
jgi:hypothetical protein